LWDIIFEPGAQSIWYFVCRDERDYRIGRKTVLPIHLLKHWRIELEKYSQYLNVFLRPVDSNEMAAA
jgi:hypothetical protein